MSSGCLLLKLRGFQRLFLCKGLSFRSRHPELIFVMPPVQGPRYRISRRGPSTWWHDKNEFRVPTGSHEQDMLLTEGYFWFFLFCWCYKRSKYLCRVFTFNIRPYALKYYVVPMYVRHGSYKYEPKSGAQIQSIASFNCHARLWLYLTMTLAACRQVLGCCAVHCQGTSSFFV